MTAILRIEHQVTDVDRWREAFDRDPVGRAHGGVEAYRIMRSVDDANLVLIDLDFAAVDHARAFLAQLRRLWEQVDVIRDPSARIVALVEVGSPLATPERA